MRAARTPLLLLLPAAVAAAIVAEWQWELWPAQSLSANATRGPGARAGSSLWYDRRAAGWWLFGGKQLTQTNTSKPKVYADLWRYEGGGWRRVYPYDNRKVIAGMLLLGTVLGDGVLLCGRAEGRRPRERSLAVYAARGAASNTVWQVELKDKLWTAYVCCCDNSERKPPSSTTIATNILPAEQNHDFKIHPKTVDHVVVANKSKPLTEHKSNITFTVRHLNKTKLITTSFKFHNKQLNESKKLNDTLTKPVVIAVSTGRPITTTKASASSRTSTATTTSSITTTRITPITTPTPVVKNASSTLTPTLLDYATLPSVYHDSNDSAEVTVAEMVLNVTECTSGKCEEFLDIQNSSLIENTDNHQQPTGRPKREAGSPIKRVSPTTAPSTKTEPTQAFCPDFDTTVQEDRGGAQPVAWCDTQRELLVAVDLHSSPLLLWHFDLRTSHWNHHQVTVQNGTLWPGCASDPNSVRSASTGSSAYILCLPYGSDSPTSTRLVYRMDARSSKLEALGQMQLNSIFESVPGQAMWTDETMTILLAMDVEGNKTLLFMAYAKLLDVWALDHSTENRHFVALENVWRGNALKWFREFSSPFYNLAVGGQTWLMANPRQLLEYWPRERGRFVVRLKDRDSESASWAPDTQVMQARNASAPAHHGGGDGIKALLFFAFSLSIFALVGVAIFVRRCVTCPPRARCDDAKVVPPPLIRYSVIPEDLAYPA